MICALLNHPADYRKKIVRKNAFPSGRQVERMNRTKKEPSMKWYYQDSHDHLGGQLCDVPVPTIMHATSNSSTSLRPAKTPAKYGHPSKIDAS
jgi:hypothetical protein